MRFPSPAIRKLAQAYSPLQEKLVKLTENRKKKILNFLLLLFFLAVLPLTVSLVRKSQEYQKKAETSLIFFDDFEKDLSKWNIYHVAAPNSVTISSEKSQSGSKSLLLHYENEKDYIRIDHNFDTPQTGIVSVYFWDDMDSSMGTFVSIKDKEETQTVFLGVNTNINPSEYVYRTGNPPNTGSYIKTHIPRSQGWHKFELVSTPKGSYGKIDGINLAFLANNEQGRGAVNTKLTSFSIILIASTWGLTSDAYYDNLKVATLETLPSSITERERALLQIFASQPPVYDPEIKVYRSKANRATVLALLGQNEEEVKNLIKEVAHEYNLWGKKWGSPMPACDLGLASWLVWDKLNLETQNLVQGVISEEADYWSTQSPQSGYVNDSKAEENAWTAAFLALAANMFSDQTNAENWGAKAKLFAFHTFTINESYGGVTTQTLHQDYLMDNHNYHPHPHYALSAGIGELARGALFYKKTGKEIPEEFKHNALNVWNAHKPYVNFTNYLWQNCEMASKFNGKDDWYADATTGDNAFTYITLLSGNDVISNLTTYEYYILRDYKGSYPTKSPGLKYLLDSVDAKRNAIALLYYDDNIKLEPIIETPLEKEPWMTNWKKFWSSKEAVWQGPEVSSEQAQVSSEKASGVSLKFTVSQGTVSISEGRTGLRWGELPSQGIWEGWVYSNQARKFRITLWVATTEGLKSKPLYTTKQAVQGWNHVEANVYEAVKSITNEQGYKNYYVEIYVNEGNTIWLDEVKKESIWLKKDTTQ